VGLKCRDCDEEVAWFDDQGWQSSQSDLNGGVHGKLIYGELTMRPEAAIPCLRCLRTWRMPAAIVDAVKAQLEYRGVE
jgi:hypothetical protein